MEILKKLKSWLSFKKEATPRVNTYLQNERKSTNEKKRSIKRNAEPISEEESVKRKYHRMETTPKSPNKTQLEEEKKKERNISLPKGSYKDHLGAKDHVRNSTPPSENHLEEEAEENTVLNDYEIETIGSIHKIREQCEKFDRDIETFTDVMGSRQFLYVDENLQSHIEKLDTIDAKESTIIRKERKSTVRYICLLIDRLEAIARKNQEQLIKPKQLNAPISREQFLEGKKEE